VKADYAVGTDTEGIGEVLDSGSLKVDYYLDTLIQMTESAVGPQQCRAPEHWLYVLKTKLKAWHVEHQQWRKDRKHRKSSPNNMSAENTQSLTATFVDTARSQDSNSSLPAQPQSTLSAPDAVMSQQSQHKVPNFGVGTAFAPWPSTGLEILPSRDDRPATVMTASPHDGLAPNDPSSYVTDMGDFSAAFQNGDLYLWDDMTDNFAAWAPQGGGTGAWGDVMQFENTMGNQGM
jgi:hypothetical protein